jgi:hypothetical protein
MADGKWQMANGKWQMANGKWQMANGKWQRRMALGIEHFLLIRFQKIQGGRRCKSKSGRGLPHSKTLARVSVPCGLRNVFS